MLVLEEKLASIKSTSTAANYNFYADPNLPEVRKLVALVHDVQSQFRGLQQIDEIGHLQPIADVLAACEKILELGHSDSLAKTIVRVEKLHEFLYEWQFRGYASRQYINPALYDRATATIVEWRKLELSTWSKLFDMEVQKCHEDTGAWWFIAYQAIIAGPLTMLESSQDLKRHTVDLLQELANYLANSMVGQFGARLALLRQMQSHVELLAQDYPALAVVRDGLRNFMSFYGRYEPRITETIQKGRGSLQKKMNEVLLLASWKDTNIAALKESARKSHLKLFRLVRKFRSVLGQLAGPIITQELSGTERSETNSIVAPAAPSPDVDQEAAEVCQRLVPAWGNDAQIDRLSKPEKILKIMASAGSLSESVVQAPEILDSFISDLAASILALRKETPGFLTEDNKDLVKHLKMRKRKLFSDTLKDVRQMGFTRNLGEKRLMLQKSLPMIFSRFGIAEPPVGLHSLDLEHYFHKVVDMTPRFRAAVYDHHDDLTQDAINRAAGYLEGILFVILQQREVLVESMDKLKCLQGSVSHIKQLGSRGLADDTIRTEKRQSNCGRVMRWLIQVLKVAIYLVDTHSRLGSTDNQPVRAQLQSWLDKFTERHGEYEALADLPDGFTSEARLRLERHLDDDLLAFRASLDAWIQERPDLTFVFQQMTAWTVAGGVDNQIETQGDGLVVFAEEMLTISKKLMEAIQKFSKIASGLPNAAEDASWLVHYSTVLSTAVKSLHIETILTDLQLWLDKLKTAQLDDESINQAASALLRVLLPILQQYTAVCQRSVFHLARLHQSTSRLGYQLSKSLTDIASQGFARRRRSLMRKVVRQES